MFYKSLPSKRPYLEQVFLGFNLFRQVITLLLSRFNNLCCIGFSVSFGYSGAFFFYSILFGMAPTRVLILGHSFIHRLKKFLATNYSVDFLRNFNLSNDLWIRWHGTGSRTISQTIQSDLGVVASFAPDVVILQLGTNDLTFLSAVEVGSALEDLTRLLFESYGVRHICVCQTLYRKGVPSFNKQVNILSQYLRVVFEPIP